MFNFEKVAFALIFMQNLTNIIKDITVLLAIYKLAKKNFSLSK